MSGKIETIFISHSTHDKDYVKSLLDIIKVAGIEEKGVKIICTSAPGYGVPEDKHIYDFLREKIHSNVWVLYILSENYYSSPVCLNEMGATWVLNKQYSTFLTPNFDFKNIRGAIDISKNAFKIDDKSRINDFKNMLLNEFELAVKDNIWESVRDESLEKIIEIAKTEKKELAKRKSQSVSIETVRKSSNDKITVTIRCINNTKYSVELCFFRLTLIDDNDNVFEKEVEPTDIRLNSEENKLYYIDFTIGESQYSAARSASVNIEDIKFINIYI